MNPSGISEEFPVAILKKTLCVMAVQLLRQFRCTLRLMIKTSFKCHVGEKNWCNQSAKFHK